MIYLDNSSTTKQYDEVTIKMLQMMQQDFGNPSSLHRLGFTAENAMKDARKSVAASIGATEKEIYFTSGGTESDNMALFSIAEAKKRQGNRIIISALEHPAVMDSAARLLSLGFEVIIIGVDEKGRLDLEQLQNAINEKTVLISVMHVNNETGTIMPIKEIYNSKKSEIIFHTDAVQAFGKIPVKADSADLITLSSHKIHGPKGCGALFLRKDIHMGPLFYGGGQEKKLRSGTENVPAIVGFGVAASIVYENQKKNAAKMSEVRRYLLEGIKAEIRDCKINSVEEDSPDGQSGFCSPAILNVSFLGTRGEVLLHGLERENIYVSTGSACASKKKEKSHVLTAMGLSEKEIEGTLRFSFSEFNTINEMDFVLNKLKQEVNRFRKLGSFR